MCKDEIKCLTNDEKIISLFYNAKENISLNNLYKLQKEIMENVDDLYLKEILLIEIDILIKYIDPSSEIVINPLKNTNCLINLYQSKMISKSTLELCLFSIPCYVGKILNIIKSDLEEKDYYELYRKCPNEDDGHLLEIFNFEMTGEIENKEDEKIMYETFKRILKK